MPRSVPKRVVTRSSKTAARGPATAPEVPSEAEKSPDSGPELDLNALIVEIDLEKLATHTFSLDEAETAFRLFDERKTEKAVFLL